MASCLLLGSRLGPLLASAGEDRSFRLALYGVAGIVLLYGLLLGLQALGLPWRPAPLGAALLLAAAGAHLGLRRRLPAPGPGGGLGFGWGDAVAGLALLALAVAAAQGWGVNMDFVYHWGIKGQKFHLAGGIDYEYLTQPWNRLRHPSYPNLLPALFAATAALAGRFQATAMLLWSAVFFALLLAAAREALRLAGASPFGRQGTLAALGLATAMAGLGHFTIGGPDWIVALAAVAGYALLLRPPEEAPDLAVGATAALAAAVKLEGAVLAAALVGAHLLRRSRAGPRAWALAVLPPALLVAAWAVPAHRHRLFVEASPVAPAWGNAGAVAKAALASLATPAWHHAGLILLVLPLLWLVRASRPAATLATAQLAAYLLLFLTWPDPSEGGVGFFIRTGFSRLFFHVFPLLLLAGGVALDRWLGGAGRSDRAYS